jgi:hypothetical protein
MQKWEYVHSLDLSFVFLVRWDESLLEERSRFNNEIEKWYIDLSARPDGYKDDVWVKTEKQIHTLQDNPLITDAIRRAYHTNPLELQWLEISDRTRRRFHGKSGLLIETGDRRVYEETFGTGVELGIDGADDVYVDYEQDVTDFHFVRRKGEENTSMETSRMIREFNSWVLIMLKKWPSGPSATGHSGQMLISD